SYDCYDECLKTQTIEWNVMSAATLIDRKKFLKSNADIAPSNIIEDWERLNSLRVNRTLPIKLIDSYQNVHSQLEGIKKFCRHSCRRPDCLSERITPQIIL